MEVAKERKIKRSKEDNKKRNRERLTCIKRNRLYITEREEEHRAKRDILRIIRE